MPLRSRLRIPSALRLRRPGSPPTDRGRLRFTPRRLVVLEDGPVVGSVGALRNPCLDYLAYMQANHPARFPTAQSVEEWRLTYEQPAADTQLECLSDLMDVRKADRRAAQAAEAQARAQVAQTQARRRV